MTKKKGEGSTATNSKSGRRRSPAAVTSSSSSRSSSRRTLETFNSSSHHHHHDSDRSQVSFLPYVEVVGDNDVDDNGNVSSYSTRESIRVRESRTTATATATAAGAPLELVGVATVTVANAPPRTVPKTVRLSQLQGKKEREDDDKLKVSWRDELDHELFQEGEDANAIALEVSYTHTRSE